MKNNIVRINEGQLKRVVAESIKNVLKEYNRKSQLSLKEEIDVDNNAPTVNDFYNYVVNRFNQEGIEVGDAGDTEELFQGCGNYDYDRVPFEELYPQVKKDWLQYKREQEEYFKESVKKSGKKTLKEWGRNFDSEDAWMDAAVMRGDTGAAKQWAQEYDRRNHPQQQPQKQQGSLDEGGSIFNYGDYNFKVNSAINTIDKDFDNLVNVIGEEYKGRKSYYKVERIEDELESISDALYNLKIYFPINKEGSEGKGFGTDGVRSF